MVCLAPLAELETQTYPLGLPAGGLGGRLARLTEGPHDLPAPGADEGEHWSDVEAQGDDPFDDFDDDDFDDEFDDDFEEDWEDDLTEDEEFPDTFGGEDEDEEFTSDGDGEEESPFSDDPDFDED